MIWVYYRVSTDKQDYNSQKMGIIEYCNRCGIKIDREVVDDGVSGTVRAKDRNLGQIIKESQFGDWVITSELSRIGRSTTDVLQSLDILAKKGVNVYFVKQGMQLDQSPMGKMMVAILSAFAEMERDLISQRTKEGLVRVKKEGRKLGREFGTKNKSYKIDEQIEEIVIYKNRGVGLKIIAKKFNSTIPTIKRALERYDNRRIM